jgi:hypothetical protein
MEDSVMLKSRMTPLAMLLVLAFAASARAREDAWIPRSPPGPVAEAADEGDSIPPFAADAPGFRLNRMWILLANAVALGVVAYGLRRIAHPVPSAGRSGDDREVPDGT